MLVALSNCVVRMEVGTLCLTEQTWVVCV